MCIWYRHAYKYTSNIAIATSATDDYATSTTIRPITTTSIKIRLKKLLLILLLLLLVLIMMTFIIMIIKIIILLLLLLIIIYVYIGGCKEDMTAISSYVC